MGQNDGAVSRAASQVGVPATPPVPPSKASSRQPRHMSSAASAASTSTTATAATQQPGLHSTLSSFFSLPWVKRGTPEILYIKRATRPTDKWSAHVAFPGGRRDETDEDGLYTAMRETWEEVGLDLADRDFVNVGQLDDREITSSLGKRLLMVLSPFGGYREIEAQQSLQPLTERVSALSRRRSLHTDHPLLTPPGASANRSSLSALGPSLAPVHPRTQMGCRLHRHLYASGSQVAGHTYALTGLAGQNGFQVYPAAQ